MQIARHRCNASVVQAGHGNAVLRETEAPGLVNHD